MPIPALVAMAKEAGVSVKDAERYWFDAEQSAEDQGRKDDYAYIMGIVKKRMGLGEANLDDPDFTGDGLPRNEWDYPMDVHFQEEITTTANLGVGNIAQTRPDQDQPFVCSSCGYGADKDLGGSCPKCGGRMAARESWIREIIRRVEAGESPREVLSSLLR